MTISEINDVESVLYQFRSIAERHPNICKHEPGCWCKQAVRDADRAIAVMRRVTQEARA